MVLGYRGIILEVVIIGLYDRLLGRIFSTYLDSHARDSAKKQHCHLVDQKPQVFDIKYKNDVILN